MKAGVKVTLIFTHHQALDNALPEERISTSIVLPDAVRELSDLREQVLRIATGAAYFTRYSLYVHCPGAGLHYHPVAQRESTFALTMNAICLYFDGHINKGSRGGHRKRSRLYLYAPIKSPFRHTDPVLYSPDFPDQRWWISEKALPHDGRPYPVNEDMCPSLLYVNADGSGFGLQLTKTTDEPIPLVGTNITYSITVQNTGMEAFTDVQVVDTIPAALQNPQLSDGGTLEGTNARWVVSTITPDVPVTLTVSGTMTLPSTGQTVTNTAQIPADPDNGIPVKLTTNISTIPATCVQTLEQALTVYQQRSATGTGIAQVEAGAEIGVVGIFIDDPSWLRVVVVVGETSRVGWTNGLLLESSCTDDAFVDGSGQIIRIPNYDPNTECLTQLAASDSTFDYYVYSLTEIANKTNRLDNLDVSNTGRIQLTGGQFVAILAIHPNRQYIRVRYYDDQDQLHDNGWVRVRNHSDPTFTKITLFPTNSTNPCRDTNGNFARTRIEALVLPDTQLPICEANQFVNCRPSTPCTSIFGCELSAIPNAFDPLTLTEFESTEDGCNNANPNCYGSDGLHPPCPAWPDDDRRHCGHDVVTLADAEYAQSQMRIVYTLRGGILRENTPQADNTYKIRTRNGTKILEYQYTHVQSNSAISTNFERGEYIAAGIELGQYIHTRQTGRTPHVHVVIKTFPIANNDENIITPNSNQPQDDDRYRAPGITEVFYVPFQDPPPEQRQNRSDVVNTTIADLRFVARPRGSVVYAYSATGLPPDLSIDANTGRITGTPMTTGTYPVVITVIDNRATPRVGHARFVWTVTP